MLADVSLTRMNLMKMKKRYAIALRGHKLLKDKQDELMRKFMELLEEIKSYRQEVENSLEKVHKQFFWAQGVMSKEFLEEAIMVPQVSLNLTTSQEQVFNIQTPKLDFHIEGDIYSYGFLFTSQQLDLALDGYKNIFPKLLHLSEIEKRAELLASEIEQTRRRVNALEYILIPELKQTIKYISMRLAELELSNQIRLMKIKDIVRKH
ncbi:MAG: V-type ATP synthase subunit D [bacterium]|nr:V-type ATP synthase subunit D [bacterium]